MARRLRLRHREAHVGEEAAGASLADVSLRRVVRLRAGRADHVDPELLGDASKLLRRHASHCAQGRLKAVRIHQDGGPEVLRYEDAPAPAPRPGEVLVRLRAASLNHLDLWVRRGLPSVPKPRILGADGAGLVESLGDGVHGFRPGQRVVLNPGVEHGSRITVIGEHTDGTHAELIAVPATNVHLLPEELSFEEAAAFPLVFETAYRMLVTRAGVRAGEWVLVWGIGAGVATAALAIAKALGARVIVTSTSEGKLARAAELGADAAIPTADARDRVKEITGGDGADVVVEHVGEATWATSLAVVRPGGRVVVCGGTSGPNPPAQLHRIWWKQLDVLGSTMGTNEDFLGAYELVKSGRARPVIDRVYPLAEARSAHERLEAGEQLGKIVLSIPD
jgi:NADPH:quinone reductase-like Zn-dependent oxidoreductase